MTVEYTIQKDNITELTQNPAGIAYTKNVCRNIIDR